MAKRDPVIVAPDQAQPDEWIVGDKQIMSLGGVFWILTVSTVIPPKGLDYICTKEIHSCVKQIAEYQARLKARATPREARINSIWDAVEEFSKQ